MPKQKTVLELEAEIAAKERQLAQLQHRQQQPENRRSYYEDSARHKTSSPALNTRSAATESLEPLAKTEFYAFAEKALALPEVKSLLMSAINAHNAAGQNENGYLSRYIHFHVTQVKRGARQSVIASAAYRSGEKLHSKCYGENSDYTQGRRDLLRNPAADPCPAKIYRLGNSLERRRESRAREKAHLHTALILPCRTNSPCRRTSPSQGSFCWRSL